MKIGLFLALFSDRSLEEALDAALAAGCETVEIMSGPWSPHCRPAELLADPAAREHLAALVAERGLTISALSCHANPLHPDAGIAAGADEAYRDTVRLAAELGVDTVITFSGCPGESEHSLRPSWVTCSWPDDFPETLAWQWDERVLPYWAEAARVRANAMGFASRSSRIRASSSTTPRRCCGSARARARASASTSIPPTCSGRAWTRSPAFDALGDAIFHVHAKDTGFHEELARAQRRARDDPRRPPGRAELDLPLGRRRASRRVLARARRRSAARRATTVRSRSSTRTRCSRTPTGSSSP